MTVSMGDSRFELAKVTGGSVGATLVSSGSWGPMPVTLMSGVRGRLEGVISGVRG